MEKNLKLRTFNGALIGAVNGIFGGGGGMVAVPLLAGSLGYEQKRAHATAIFVIAPVCLISAVVYAIGGYVRADVLIPASLGSVAGGLVGAVFLGKLPRLLVDLIFIAVMAAAGIRMFVG